MMTRAVVTLLLLFATLAGCSSRSGCSGDACKRPDSNDRELVIWWPLDMRQGLDDRDHELDFTVVPLKD
jgi:uncharacterized lipoprotein NlpE involved in copper resistance